MPSTSACGLYRGACVCARQATFGYISPAAGAARFLLEPPQNALVVKQMAAWQTGCVLPFLHAGKAHRAFHTRASACHRHVLLCASVHTSEQKPFAAAVSRAFATCACDIQVMENEE